MPEELFLSEQHPRSLRYAVLEDNGRCGWLYLTEPANTRPIADVWVYNRALLEAPEQLNAAPSPPPAPARYLNAGAVCEAPHRHTWSLLWSSDGESVAVLKDCTPLAIVCSDQKRGYTRHLTVSTPWGLPWSEQTFRRLSQRDT